MYVDVKVTTWNRIEISEENVTAKQVEELLKKGDYYSLWDLDSNIKSGQLTESETDITPEDNSGFSTIELYNNDGNLLWENGKGNLNGF